MICWNEIPSGKCLNSPNEKKNPIPSTWCIHIDISIHLTADRILERWNIFHEKKDTFNDKCQNK